VEFCLLFIGGQKYHLVLIAMAKLLAILCAVAVLRLTAVVQFIAIHEVLVL